MTGFRLKLSIFSVAAIAFFSLQAFAADEGGESQEITLRAKGGLSFLSKTDPVNDGWGLGADIRFGITNKFGIGATFSHAWGSGSTSNPSTSVSHNVTIMGVNPYYGISKSGVAASVGLIAGAMISSRTTTIFTSPSTTTSDSASRFALGMNATIDIPLASKFFFTLVPEYVHSLGSGDNIGSASIRGGFGLSL